MVLLIAVSLFLGQRAVVWAEKVPVKLVLEKIAVSGNAYFHQKDILFGNKEEKLPGVDLWEGESYTVLERDAELTSPEIEAQRQKLEEVGFFASVTVQLQRVGEKSFKVLFQVKENPRFSKLILKGKTPFSQEKLSSLFSLQPGVPINKQGLQEAAKAIALLYQKEGKRGGVSDISIQDSGEVVVQLGSAKIEKISFEGNVLIPEKEIRFLILSKEGDAWDEETIQKDRQRLLDSGWFKKVQFEGKGAKDAPLDLTLTFHLTEKWKPVMAKVTNQGNRHLPKSFFEPLITLKPGDPLTAGKLSAIESAISATGLVQDVKTSYASVKDGTQVIFTIVENPFITDIAFQGNTIFSDAELVDQMLTKKNQVLNVILLQNDIRRIEKFYFDHGYIVTRIYDNSLDLKNGEGKLTLFVGEGKVESILIQGQKEQQVVGQNGETERKIVPTKLKTKDYVILREMQVKPGQILNVHTLEKDLQKIFNLGFFEDVRWEPQPGSSPDGLVVVLKVKERQTMGTANFGAGFSSQFGLSGTVSLSRQNLFGRGRLVSIDLSFGGLTSYQTRYFEPWIDHHHTSLDVQAFNTVVPKDLVNPFTQSVSSFDETRRGFSFLIGRPLTRYTTLSLGYEFKSVASRLVSGTPLFGILTRGNVGAVRLDLTSDTRDNRFNASKGIFNEVRAKFSNSIIGADVSFLRLDLDVRRYKKITHNTILAGRILAGYYAGNQTLLEETFFVGGSDTIRGYRQNIFWGTRMFVSNLEWRIPLSSAQGITTVLFTDTGFAWPPNTSVDLSQLKTGVGMGLRYQLPIGPIRIDVGYGIQARDTQFYLSFGNLF